MSTKILLIILTRLIAVLSNLGLLLLGAGLSAFLFTTDLTDKAKILALAIMAIGSLFYALAFVLDIVVSSLDIDGKGG